MKLSQKGFSAFEILITVVIVGLIGAVGWLVFDRQKTNDKSATADTAAQTKPTEKAEPVATEEENKQFQIKEFGVEFVPTSSLDGLYYVIGNNGNTAYFSTEELKDTDCAADKTSQIALTRFTEEDIASDPQGEAFKTDAKKIGDYYYNAIGGQAACSEDSTIQQKASKMRMDIAQILPEALTPIE